MGFRFRRTIKVAPGVRLNIGKNGVSTSIGKRGAGITFGKNGTTAHVGIPGTGMSYTTRVGSGNTEQANIKHQSNNGKSSSGCGCFLLASVLFALLWFVTLGYIADTYGTKSSNLFIIASLTIPILLCAALFLFGHVKKKESKQILEREDNIKENTPSFNKDENIPSLINIDPYFDDAAHLAVSKQQVSITILQTNFQIGYNRATRIMNQLYLAEIVDFKKGNSSRKVLIKEIDYLNKWLEKIHKNAKKQKPEAHIKEEPCVIDLTDFANPIKEDNTSGKSENITPRVNAIDKSKPINPWDTFVRWKFLTCDLLKKYDSNPSIDMGEIKANNAHIVQILKNFGIGISKINAIVGPTVTLYEISLADGVRISQIRGVEDYIALSLASYGIRIVAPIPGKGTVGIEIPNKNRLLVSIENVLNTKEFQKSDMALPIALGKTIDNKPFIVDLAKLPQLLIAGATGQGKSVSLNVIITSLLFKKRPNELKFVLIDPKDVEFSIWSKIAPYYMAALPENIKDPIITDAHQAVRTLNSLCKLLDYRYDLLRKLQVRKINEYNDKLIHHVLNPKDGYELMPYIVVLIDGYGELFVEKSNEIESSIIKLAQLGRAVGIHLIIATQKPTADIFKDNIKANFPGRMAFHVNSKTDSRTILDYDGAEHLIDQGDILFRISGEPIRIQGAFIDSSEIEAVSDFIACQPDSIEPLELPQSENDMTSNNANDSFLENLDPYFEEAARAIVITQQGSSSMLQRRLSIGYNRVGRLMDQLENAGIVGPAQGSKPRDVLIRDEKTLDTILRNLKNKYD